MRIVAFVAGNAARLVPLNAIVQALHALMRPDVFHPPGAPDRLTQQFADMLTRRQGAATARLEAARARFADGGATVWQAS